MKPFLENEPRRCAPQRRITRSISAAAGRAARSRDLRRLRVAHADIGHQFGDRRTDRGPVRRVGVAGMGQRLAQPLQPAFVLQGRQPGAAEQRPQRRVAERGLVEFAEMGVAAAVVQQQGIADVVQRRAVLPGGQRPKRRTGKILETHAVSFSRNGKPHGMIPKWQGISHRRPDPACKPLKTIQVGGKRKCDACHIFGRKFPPSSQPIGSMRQRRLPRPAVRVKGFFVAVPQIDRNSTAQTAQPLKPNRHWRD